MNKFLLLLVLSSSLSECRPSREERQFGWLWGNSEEKQAEKKHEPRLKPTQVLQRRTNQFVNEIQGNAIGNYKNLPPQPIINRKYPAPPISNYKGLRRPALPPPKKPTQRKENRVVVDKRKILMPVIISSYASTNIQGRGNDDQEKIKEAIEKYEKLNEISDDIDNEDIKEEVVTEIKEKYSDRVEAKVVELKIDNGNIIEEEEEDILILGAPINNDVVVSTTTELIDSTSAEELASTTTTATTTQPLVEENSSEFVTDAPFSNEIEEYDGRSPYLPEIPENLDEEIHGTPSKNEVAVEKENHSEKYLAGYQQVEAIKNDNGDDRTEQQTVPSKDITNPKVPVVKGLQKKNIYPLGKPLQRPPLKKTPQVQKLPEEKEESSFFDFLPFWKSSAQTKPKRPPPPQLRRPVGPTVTKLEQELQPDYPKGLQAPVLLKVGSPQLSVSSKPTSGSLYPAQETPERPETIEQPSENARIDNTINTEFESDTQEAFIVLPVKETKPQHHKQKQPNKPDQIFNYPGRSNSRPPPPRKNSPPPSIRRPPPPPQRYPQRPLHNRGNTNAPLPMLSQPVIGLPQVPASRKQSPFIAKRPPLPPQLPSTYPGGPKKFYPQNPKLKPQITRTPVIKPIRPTNVPKKPSKKIVKKPEPFPQKPIQKIPPPTKAPQTKPIDFKPNGSSKPASDIASHLSSLLNSFFSTTASPAPAPSLPSLVEDTEFADIVNGYKASDEKKQEVKKTIPNKSKPISRGPPTTASTVIKSEESLYDDLDSLSAPSLETEPKINHPLLTKSTVVTTTPLPQTTSNTELSTTSTTITTTTTTPSPTSTIQTTTLQLTTLTLPSAIPVQREETTVTFISPIQELVNEYQKKGHVVPQNQYPEPVLKAIQKNFEHKKNIFEQFVSFDEGDKAFIPNKEVYGSDWSRVNPVNLSDKLLVYQTFAPSETTPHTPSTLPPQTSTIKFDETKSNPKFPHERNAEGGFRPMLRPLHSPLLN